MSNNVSEFKRKDPSQQDQQKSAIEFSNELIKLANKYNRKLQVKTMLLGLESVKLDLLIGGE